MGTQVRKITIPPLSELVTNVRLPPNAFSADSLVLIEDCVKSDDCLIAHSLSNFNVNSVLLIKIFNLKSETIHINKGFKLEKVELFHENPASVNYIQTDAANTFEKSFEAWGDEDLDFSYLSSEERKTVTELLL